jgi:Flp pilus assembly protein CpaB
VPPIEQPSSASSSAVPSSDHDARTESRPKASLLRRGPYSWLVLILVLASVAIIVAASAWRHVNQASAEVAVLIATRNLPAYHVLTDGDVSLGLAMVRGNNNHPTFPVAGSITLRPIAKGQPVTSEDVSSDVVQLLGADAAVTGLSISSASALGGTLSGGDEIQILLAGGREPVKIEAVVLSASGRGASPGHDNLVVALPERLAQRYGSQLAGGNFAVIVLPGS